MGQSSSSSSSGRPRRDDYHHQTQPPPTRPHQPLPLPPPPPQSQIASTSSTSYPPLPQPYYNASYYHQYPNPNPNNYGHYSGQPPYNPYYAPPPSYWAPMAPPPVRPLVAPPPFVERESTKKVKNDVNLHKNTIKLVPDEQNPDLHLVSFVFDASVDGSVTIYYFAKEGPNCTFSPAIPGIGTSTSVPFQKGAAQKFIQPPGSGIDLGFFPLDELSKPSEDGVFPLVIYADATPKSMTQPEQLQRASTHAQITLAVIERSNEGAFVVKVVKQILWIDGEKYELQEIFGLVSSPEPEVKSIEDDDLGKDCVICLSEPKDTAVLPCRHMCLCSECAKALRLQSNKCPICRQPIEQLIEISVNNTEK
ncbi:RING/U-box superfamily protein [Rhynchospora pubera]|uniref:RING-type E3 ubiquitin transferase n=1 Tax=Rhynchospora pubera TaxID=906938 RepID=A0AAV8E2F0_9POAL|nr:RING/U-box superfamily protein [Rhynchospora pubera]